MSDTETAGAIELAAASPPPPPPVAVNPPGRRSLWPFAFAAGFLLLAAGEFLLWQLHQPQAAQLAVLTAEVTDLRSAAARSPVSAEADLSLKLADLAAQLNAVQSQAAADHGALGELQANAADLTQLTARITTLSALESARIALESGAPLGTLANAPPALAQFAQTPPPTEAALRLSFPAAAQKAEAASIAGAPHGGFWSQVLARLESLITIREGTHVLAGPPAAGALAAAQTDLDAGDLAGAVAQLQTLSSATQAAMGTWLTQAKALLAARAALVSMASQ
jgi:hypothetical protein